MRRFHQRFQDSDETPEEQQERVGFPLEEFKPKHSPDDPFAKLFVLAFTVFTLFYPTVHVRSHLGDIGLSFAVSAAVVFGINLVLAVVLLARLWSIHEKWTEAKSMIGSANGYTACRAVQTAFLTFRRLTKWNLLFRYTGHWTTFLYILLFALSALHWDALKLNDDAWVPKSHLVFLFGDLGRELLAYYFILFFLPRLVIRALIARFTRHVDPTYQICSALGEIHHRYRLATLPRR